MNQSILAVAHFKRMTVICVRLTMGSPAEVNHCRMFLQWAICFHEFLEFEKALNDFDLTLASDGKASPMGIVIEGIQQALGGEVYALGFIDREANTS